MIFRACQSCQAKAEATVQYTRGESFMPTPFCEHCVSDLFRSLKPLATPAINTFSYTRIPAHARAAA